MLRSVSLANKCLLLFGLAIVAIILAALSVTWLRLNRQIDSGRLATSREVIATWQAQARRIGERERGASAGLQGLFPGDRFVQGENTIVVIGPADAAAAEAELTRPGIDSSDARFAERRDVLDAWRMLRDNPELTEFSRVRRQVFTRTYVVAKPLRGVVVPVGAESLAPPPTDPTINPPAGTVAGTTVLDAAIILRKDSQDAGTEMLVNSGVLLGAALLALALAVLVFYLITNKIILSPVRSLRDTAERVRSGDMSVRSDIHTGDEFEELAETFNEMLASMQTSQSQLRALNTQLDDKLSELEQTNRSLFESSKLKNEFLANVTHELRTPLNNVIGFAELLDEQAMKEAEAGDDSTRLSKRRRYVDNILTAGKSLLELVNGLLEMAKVEAGKVDLRLTSINLAEHCETLLTMMRPVADKRAVELRYEGPEIEKQLSILTDGRKLQQILFNLLSNAIKFTADAADARESQMAQMDAEAATRLSRNAVVIVRVEHLPDRSAETSASGDDLTAGGLGKTDMVRISVLDTGPGIGREDKERIFEKFTQLDSGLGRKHAGTGLGLAIVKELTQLLQGEIQVQSELGRGSMFSLILPAAMDPRKSAEAKLESTFRGMLASQRVSN